MPVKAQETMAMMCWKVKLPTMGWAWTWRSSQFLGRGQVWLRERVPFVEGQELSPLVQAALMADYAHPISNAGRHGLSFINADLTVYLARYPEKKKKRKK